MARTLNINRKVLESVDVLIAEHSVGLSSTCGAICETSGVVPVEDGLDEFLSGL